MQGQPSCRACLPFETGEAKVRRYATEIDQHRDHVPRDHGPREDEEAVVNPHNLKSTHDGRHRGIDTLARPAPEHLDQVGTAAKVVPNPATNPSTSDRENLGRSRLDVS